MDNKWRKNPEEVLARVLEYFSHEFQFGSICHLLVKINRNIWRNLIEEVGLSLQQMLLKLSIEIYANVYFRKVLNIKQLLDKNSKTFLKKFPLSHSQTFSLKNKCIKSWWLNTLNKIRFSCSAIFHSFKRFLSFV